MTFAEGHLNIASIKRQSIPADRMIAHAAGRCTNFFDMLDVYLDRQSAINCHTTLGPLGRNKQG
jgi:hypothetical protein